MTALTTLATRVRWTSTKTLQELGLAPPATKATPTQQPEAPLVTALTKQSGKVATVPVTVQEQLPSPVAALAEALKLTCCPQPTATTEAVSARLTTSEQTLPNLTSTEQAPA